jgi:purine nucleosidase
LSAPIVLDSDIGTDIDDVYALILAATSPELDLLTVTTVNCDVVLRARIAVRLLRLTGRGDVPVSVGRGEPLTQGVSRGWEGHEGKGANLQRIGPSDFHALPAPEQIAHLADRCFREARPLTLVTIGALTNTADLIRRFPEDARRLKQIVSMASSFEGYGPSNGRVEHNVACDPDAAAIVLESGIPVTLVGLNVTTRTRLGAEQVREFEGIGGTLAREVASLHRVWFEFTRGTASAMHDPLAVASLVDPALCEWADVVPDTSCQGAEPGAIVYNAPLPGEVTHCRVAVAVDTDAFHSYFLARIRSALETRRQVEGLGV